VSGDPYVYPGTRVLRNNYGIRDAAELARRENDAATVRLLQLRLYPLAGTYDIEHLRAFHRHIFGDVYPWAGEIRTIAIAKTDLFALPQHIEPFLADVLAQLAAEQYLRGLESDPIVDRLTHYLAEINAAHPFREGNGRTQRAFIGQLANHAGYGIAWERADPTDNLNGSIAAMRGDNTPLRTMLSGLVYPRSDRPH
jgi:cell filamentation protein